jgi:hypothetical protein
VSANGRAIITMDGLDQATVELNLITGTQRVVHGPYNRDEDIPQVRRSADGLWIVATGPRWGVTYDATTDTYCGGCAQDAIGDPVITSVADGPSNFFFVRHDLLDRNMGDYGILGLDSVPVYGIAPLYGAAAAPNGIDLYMAESPCMLSDVACVSVSPGRLLHYKAAVTPIGRVGTGLRGTDGILLDVGDIPNAAYALSVSPDSKTLLAIGRTTITALDLTQTGAPSGARVRGSTTRPGPTAVSQAPHVLQAHVVSSLPVVHLGDRRSGRTVPDVVLSPSR